eukprot:CAMPEP_0113300698 /NCGR_PEP_ID=MMETSP0010_2-20120614/2217_1 /TAXON_ID=216773 ORGANISM="Corethron hystrix, Strain 308" /NCGR_SAMPLE_ID=MMETSP0010_2 /ASSEMBLY_ACC=CAM_ASM_000155 /LENGTH=1531 /DNA_ID=CAMNT_0000154161 /DNA_START=1784 /DNA_END=6380 /DNA_ORIENTATION=- /assembly_acc=CAM_ASM_000155
MGRRNDFNNPMNKLSGSLPPGLGTNRSQLSVGAGNSGPSRKRGRGDLSLTQNGMGIVAGSIGIGGMDDHGSGGLGHGASHGMGGRLSRNVHPNQRYGPASGNVAACRISPTPGVIRQQSLSHRDGFGPPPSRTDGPSSHLSPSGRLPLSAVSRGGVSDGGPPMFECMGGRGPAPLPPERFGQRGDSGLGQGRGMPPPLHLLNGRDGVGPGRPIGERRERNYPPERPFFKGGGRLFKPGGSDMQNYCRPSPDFRPRNDQPSPRFRGERSLPLNARFSRTEELPPSQPFLRQRMENSEDLRRFDLSSRKESRNELSRQLQLERLEQLQKNTIFPPKTAEDSSCRPSSPLNQKSTPLTPFLRGGNGKDKDLLSSPLTSGGTHVAKSPRSETFLECNSLLTKNMNKQFSGNERKVNVASHKSLKEQHQQEEVTPLTCLSLGSTQKAVKAERLIGKLAKLLSAPDLGQYQGCRNNVEELELPSNEHIFDGIKHIDSLIEKKMEEKKNCESKLSELKNKEEAMFNLVEKEREEIRREFKIILERMRVAMENEIKETSLTADILQEENDDSIEKQAVTSARAALHHASESVIKGEMAENDADARSNDREAKVESVSKQISALEPHFVSPASFQRLFGKQQHFLALDSPGETKELVQMITEENNQRVIFSHESSLDALSGLARTVSGPANALYLEPMANPLFEHTDECYKKNRHHIMRTVHSQNVVLHNHWEKLGKIYRYHYKTWDEEKRRDLCSSSDEYSKKRKFDDMESDYVGVRNTHRRPRRSNGNDVARSDYDQDQIIKELTAKETRISKGGSDLPRQRCTLERKIFVSYIDQLHSRRIYDPKQDQQFHDAVNPWSDIEKCIFLDKFLQFPKDFRKISTYLRNKSTFDCVRFYYDSKKSIQYKAMLQEHQGRRKGHCHSWEIAHQAARCVGAKMTIDPETDILTFSLPHDENTFNTRHLHPLRGKEGKKLKEIVDAMDYNDDVLPQPTTSADDSKLSQPELHSFDNEETTKIKHSNDFDDTSSEQHQQFNRKKAQLLPTEVLVKEEPVAVASPPPKQPKTSKSSSSDPNSINSSGKKYLGKEGGSKEKPGEKKPVQKWTEDEKHLFSKGFEKFGKAWEKLEMLIGSKSIVQIKNYYQKNKVRLVYAKKKDVPTQSVPSAGGEMEFCITGQTISGGVLENKSNTMQSSTERNKEFDLAEFKSSTVVSSSQQNQTFKKKDSRLQSIQAFPRASKLESLQDDFHRVLDNSMHLSTDSAATSKSTQQCNRQDRDRDSSPVMDMTDSMQWTNHKYAQAGALLRTAQDTGPSNSQSGSQQHFLKQSSSHQISKSLQLQNMQFAHHLGLVEFHNLNTLRMAADTSVRLNQMNTLHSGLHIPYSSHSSRYHDLPISNGATSAPLEHVNYSNDNNKNLTKTSNGFQNSENKHTNQKKFHPAAAVATASSFLNKKIPQQEHVEGLQKQQVATASPATSNSGVHQHKPIHNINGLLMGVDSGGRHCPKNSQTKQYFNMNRRTIHQDGGGRNVPPSSYQNNIEPSQK